MTTEFSVVIATATGEDHLADCLAAILSQEPGEYRCEVIVVIDGPSDRLHRIASAFQERFSEAGVAMRIEEMQRRMGRLLARLQGADLAIFEQLLIVDDRNILQPAFVNRLVDMQAEVVIPSLKELRSPTFISTTLNLVRSRVYKGWDGLTQQTYWVDSDTFEQTAKTTGGLWVPRDAFVAASREIARDAANPALVSDDTRLLRLLLDRGLQVLKSGEVLLTYEPRTRFLDEVRHLFARGPLFIDYYSRPGTRYFPFLLGGMALLVITLAAGVLWPPVLLLAAAGAAVVLIVTTVVLAERWSDLPKLLIGIPVAGTAFTAGVIRGLLVRVVGRRAKT